MSRESVFLLHGLARTARSMKPMAEALDRDGYRAINVGYPSRAHRLDELARMVAARFRETVQQSTVTHLVAHSMGGLIARLLLKAHGGAGVGRAVFTGTPNRGSEVAARFLKGGPFLWLYGPAGRQLDLESISALDPGVPPCPFGVIAGTRRFHPLNVSGYLAWTVFGSGTENDGSVSVQSTRLEGMTDFTTVDVNHVMLPRHPEVIRLVRRFLSAGSFGKRGGENGNGYFTP
jgi:pimeloyl-ACP methyl ester carboxylesterase